MKKMTFGVLTIGLSFAITWNAAIATQDHTKAGPTDPGLRSGQYVGGPLQSLTPSELGIFEAGQAAFQEADSVADGLGPRFNLDRCSGCHSQPKIGGSAPAVNPQLVIGTDFGARNKIPTFVRRDGPIVEARFKKFPDGSVDGGVHSLFVISGRVDSTGDATKCSAVQEDFDGDFAKNNVSLRTPTPTFGTGLIEAIADGAILANLRADRAEKERSGISGRPNRNGNTGNIGRLGWKAQNASLLLFSGEAYNVESGISNELFPNEREDKPTCQYGPVPNDSSEMGTANKQATAAVNDIELFTLFMKFLAAPAPSMDNPGGSASIARGRRSFETVGCGLCHTPSLRTTYFTRVAALKRQQMNLYSDLVLHNMGPRLADDISQGDAGGDEFRTAPLWGLGQRIFFLHDGRTKDVRDAIYPHWSKGDSRYGPSEANQVIENFHSLPRSSRQDVLNFLRSL
jgi:CxxC motif-containing protein (DUF1111 family)